MKKKTYYKCDQCGYISSGYLGKCPGCNSWGSIKEFSESTSTKSGKLKSAPSKSAQKLSQIESSNSERVKTGIEEFNRVMGGGIIKDSITILTAKPGAGKSTLLLQVANDLALKGKKVLYASGEESETQIKSRAKRILDEISNNIWVYSGNSMDDVLAEIENSDPDFIILDSIQTFTLSEFTSRAGTPTQTMECANKMVEASKNYNRPRMVFLVGQMTKEEELAGVRALEHLVDTVLLIEGDSSEELRQLFSSKNRYGSTGEMGFFQMTEKGMVSLDNPSEHFMTMREKGEEVPGSALSIIREGTRPIILEIEALVSKSYTPYPTRIGECLKREHLGTLISILEERGGIKLYDKNVVVKTTGGIKLKETASNLALIISMASALLNKPVQGKSVFIGDVGLTGELKTVPTIDLRINEAARIGFEKIYTPPLKDNLKKKYKDINIVESKNIREVIDKVFNLS